VNDRLPACVIDWETQYDKDKTDPCSVVNLGVRAYCEHPRFDPYMVAVVAERFPGDKEPDEFVGDPSEFDWECVQNHQPVAHNAQFDWTIFNWWVEKISPITCNGSSGSYSWSKAIVDPHHAFISRRPWHCTASMAAYLSAGRSLAAASKSLLGKELDKGMRDWMCGKTWKDAIAAGKADDMRRYALGDAKAELEIYQLGYNKWPEHERWLATHTIISGMRGVRIDSAYLDECHEKLLDELAKIESDLPWLNDMSYLDKKGNKPKPTSKTALAKACRDLGIEPPQSTAVDSPLLEKWELAHPDVPLVKTMQQHRGVSKALGTIELLKKRSVGGIFTFSTKYFGAHTGRWSGDGGYNMHGQKKEAVAGVDVRKGFIARPGKVLFIGDLAQIEARQTLWFAEDWDSLKLIEDGVSVYEAHARQTMGWTGGVLKKEDKDLYALAKARVLGLGFGCGWKKFIEAAKKMAGVTIDASTSKKTVNAFRATNPGIVRVWETLDRDVSNSVGGDYELELPSGRVLQYFNVKKTRNDRGKFETQAQQVMDAPHKGVYGGLLFENLVQATARDILADIVMRLEAAGFTVLFTVHDEVVCEIDPGRGPEAAAIMRAPISWVPRLPIDIEWQESPCYLK